MIIKKQSVETIKRALKLYVDVKAASARSANKSVSNCAVRSFQEGLDAMNDLDRLLASFGSGQTEDGVEVLFYL